MSHFQQKPEPMFEQAFKNIDDVLRKEAGCTTELDYTEQTSCLLRCALTDRSEVGEAQLASYNGLIWNVFSRSTRNASPGVVPIKA